MPLSQAIMVIREMYRKMRKRCQASSFQHMSPWIVRGAELFQVYMGPYKDRSNATGAICLYKKNFNKTTYGIKLSEKPGREEFRCE